MPNTKLIDWRPAKWAQNAVYSLVNQAKILSGYAPNDIVPSAEHNELFNQATVAIGELQTAGTLLYNDQLSVPAGHVFSVMVGGVAYQRQAKTAQPAGFNPDPSTNPNILPFPNPLSADEVSTVAAVDANLFPAVDATTVEGQIAQLAQRTAFLRNVGGKNIPIGVLMFTAAETADPGWLMLGETNQLVNIVQYPEAFAKFGTRYGGNGTTTFGIPSLKQGYALLGKGAAGIGAETAGEVKAHNHVFKTAGPGITGSGNTYRGIEDNDTFNTIPHDTSTVGGTANLSAGKYFPIMVKMYDVLSPAHFDLVEGGNYIWPERVVELGDVSGTVNIDFSAGTYFSMNAVGDFTITTSNRPVIGLTYEFGLKITNGGAHTVAWPADWDVEGSLAVSGVSVVQGYIESADTRAWVMYAASDAGVEALRADLANNTDPVEGAALVGVAPITSTPTYTEVLTGTLFAVLSGIVGRIKMLFSCSEVSVFWFMTPAQIEDVIAGARVYNTLPAFDSAASYAAGFGGTVKIPAGLYRHDSQWTVPANISVVGEGRPYPVSTYNPTARTCGSLIYKNHNGHGFYVDGGAAYRDCGGVKNLGVISNYDTWDMGNGFHINLVGFYNIEDCVVFSVGGRGFQIGETVGDVTGQVTMRNCYVNNAESEAYYFRCKWLRANNLASDGGTWSAWFQDAPEALVSGFHFEGANTGGVKLAGANGWNTLHKGFIALTNPSALQAVDIAGVGGNVRSVFDNVHFVGHTTAGLKAVVLSAGANHTCFDTCWFYQFPVGIENKADFTTTKDTVFDSVALPIDTYNDGYKIKDNTFVGTSGPYSVKHSGGGLGEWSGNRCDKPMFSAVYGGTKGYFGTNTVVRNKGYITDTKLQTGAVTSPHVVAHGMSVEPNYVFVDCVSPFTKPADLQIGTDGTNITLTWASGGSKQFSIQAFGASA